MIHALNVKQREREDFSFLVNVRKKYFVFFFFYFTCAYIKTSEAIIWILFVVIKVYPLLYMYVTFSVKGRNY